MNQMPLALEKVMKQILIASVLINLALFAMLSAGFITVSEAQMRWAGGVFLMLFVCTHGWYRYGLYSMVLFFCITLVVTWSLESLSIVTGFPFGQFVYSDKLGEKIGHVPIMIFPAYFFNGYLAWTTSQLIWGKQGTGITKKQLFLLPPTSALLMVAWNASFDPIMSTLQGYWTWQNGGAYFGVPLSNFAGWFVTVNLFFQIFAYVLYRFSADSQIAVGRYYWSLIPVMYGIQGLPYFLYPFFRSQDVTIYRSMALVTAMAMFLPAILSFVASYTRDHRDQWRQTD